MAPSQSGEVAVHLLDGLLGQFAVATAEVDGQRRQVGSGRHVTSGKHLGQRYAQGSGQPGQLVRVRAVDRSDLEPGNDRVANPAAVLEVSKRQAEFLTLGAEERPDALDLVWSHVTHWFLV